LVAAVGIVAVLAAASLGLARSSGAVSTTVGNLELTANASVASTTLEVGGSIRTTDGSHPAAAQEVEIAIGKSATIDVSGFPTCRLGLVQVSESAAAEAACAKALIGTGRATVLVAFPEQVPISVRSKLLVFNGGEKNGVVTLYVHAYFYAPISGAVIVPVTIRKVHRAQYGLLATAAIPEIADGDGSMTAFDLRIGKRYTDEGKKRSILGLRCRDAKIPFDVTSRFVDGTVASVELARPCGT
jgi:hypothetical protein